MWLLERKHNPHFQGSRASGVSSGLWWAVVTMATVGYGDKVPRTGAGRLLAMLWMLASLIILTTVTAAITSSLTVGRLEAKVSGSEDLGKLRVCRDRCAGDRRTGLRRSHAQGAGRDRISYGHRRITPHLSASRLRIRAPHRQFAARADQPHSRPPDAELLTESATPMAEFTAHGSAAGSRGTRPRTRATSPRDAPAFGSAARRRRPRGPWLRAGADESAGGRSAR